MDKKGAVIIMNELQKQDLDYIWHPCSQMKDYEELLPIIIKKAEGAYLTDINGKRYLDAISSWWVNTLGHCNKRINTAIKKQLDNLEHVIFANFSHEPAINLAKRIINIAPDGLKKVFFADNGSSAVEIALKLSFQYHQQTGNENKKRFLAISNSYHGETLGALAVGDIDLYSKVYKPLMMDTIKAEGPNCFRCKYGKERLSCNSECFENIENILLSMNHDIAAVIIEPIIQVASGINIYSPKYLKKLRKLCKDTNVHLIADEIAVGFGRTGKMFACKNANISPDIMCLSKGLTAGYLPLALTIMTDEIYNAFYDDYKELKAFMHSHSFTGNPLSCTAAVESLKIFDEENILKRNEIKSQLINDYAKEYFDYHKYIGEYRQLGMVGAIELVEDKITKKPFDWKKRVGYEIYKIALRKGLLIRPLGNVIYFMPPYVIDESDIKFMIEETYNSINEFLNS